MGLSSQLSSTTICKHYCWEKRELRTSSKRKAIGGIGHRVLGNLYYSAGSYTVPLLPCYRGFLHVSIADARSKPNVVTGATNGPFPVTHDAGTEHDLYKATNRQNSAPNGCMPTDIQDEAETLELVDVIPSSSSSLPLNRVGQTDQPEGTSNGFTSLVLPSTNLSNATYFPPAHEHDNGDSIETGSSHDTSTCHTPSDAGQKEEGRIRRFSFSEPELLKTLQGSKTLTPLEQINLEKVLKFKVTTNNLQGQLVIRAVRIEQIKDLENLLTDSYSELMWGPLTYRPVLAWILSSYLRERQAQLPNSATLVGLYKPSEETMVHEELAPKWWLAGAVEVSFNASGKPDGMQAPLPPEDAPFLSNMAVLKRFRRRGIGRELLKAAEQLALQMGSTEMYLHCRMVDEAPLNMYRSSGYSVLETDSILSLLLFQRRRHLMYKQLVEPVK
ncbi:hypothetical protein L7F22_067818 [Adiantum nelumboides]|nr:hypothetical protein [Adiantum nelumboides]